MGQLGEELDRVVSAWIDRVGKREAGGGPWRDIDVELSIFPLGESSADPVRAGSWPADQ